MSGEMNVHRVDCKRSAPLFQAATVCNMHINSLHIFPWNIPLVLNDKGGLMPRTEFKQTVTEISWNTSPQMCLKGHKEELKQTL